MITKRGIGKFRAVVQAASTILLNSYWKVLLVFGLYQGPLKMICVPVLNCYACPAAVGACPIGTIQHFFTIGAVPFYALGVILLTGVLVGRATCGWLCPFGFLQEILYKIPTKKMTIPVWTRGIKYVILVVFVIVLPLTLGVTTDEEGSHHLSFSRDSVRQPWFCKLVCPAGTLEGGIPTVVADPNVRMMLYDTSVRESVRRSIELLESEEYEEREEAFSRLQSITQQDFGYSPALPPLYQPEPIQKWQTWYNSHSQGFVKFKGWLFVWKIFFLIILLIAIITVKRFFCCVLCPLGAIFGIFNAISGIKISLKKKECPRCNLCRPMCPVDIEPFKDYDSPECIRCYNCTTCDALQLSTIFDNNASKEPAAFKGEQQKSENVIDHQE